ncbi:three component ABC system middle component [Accumulibacter sp.]|jgi:hypothetical protein|uniref:three component ABC system middle component n=1 Tax=Accumulibacter sp. TaxID=2053492 RepID=UPI003DA8D819
MTVWANRSHEERALLNPSFCATLLWHAARGHVAEGNVALSFEESFLVLPFILHRGTRETLPRSGRTSLAAWLEEYPLARVRVASRARFLVPFTKEALTFGGAHGLIRLDSGRLHADPDWQRVVNRVIKMSSDEVKNSVSRAAFIGQWFARAGNAATVLALIGVRP